jgi:hypothetical protein
MLVIRILRAMQLKERGFTAEAAAGLAAAGGARHRWPPGT